MKTKNLVIAAIIAAFLFSLPPAFAACSSACSTENQYSCSLTTSTMAKSTSGTLTVQVTNQQSQSQSSVATTLQDLGWFTGTTTTSTISSINVGASASLDYSITPTSDGAQDVCVRMGSTCTADCGSITITSPAALSITSLTTSASSISTSATTTASASIYNSGTETAGSSTGVTATLSSSSGCTVASGAKTIGTIAGKQTNSQSWTVTAGSSAATCTLTLSVSGTAGGSDSTTATLTVTAASSNASSSSSSSGGGSSSNATNATKDKETKLFSTTAGVSKLLTFTQTTTGITDIELKTAASKTSIQVSVDAGSLPSGASTPAVSVYKYMEISSTAANSDFSLIKIKFKVPKSWVTSNSVDVATISLFRYSSGWSKLSTTQTSSDSSDYYFEAESPGFSTFAVAAEKGSPTAPTPATPSTPSTPTTPETPAPAGPGESTPSVPSVPVGSTDPNVIVGIVVLILAVGFGVVHHFLLKQKGGYRHSPLREVYSSSPRREEKRRYEYRPNKK
ncbi:MAG: PGF-pre-PGF domain-containing protein [Candidatus Aenigmarchaeota archaeon]|nr:PGF-pre-PGF domain-containing protein [Candidatus Aenigmarchaeota archaeon]